MQRVGLYIPGIERLGALEGLSVITDDQPSVATADSSSASERLVVSSSAAGTLSPNEVTCGQETQVAGTQSTSQLRGQMYVIYIIRALSIVLVGNFCQCISFIL